MHVRFPYTHSFCFLSSKAVHLVANFAPLIDFYFQHFCKYIDPPKKFILSLLIFFVLYKADNIIFYQLC